ncbi:hypothetical protein BKA93DRAFT_809182 [Sparassis latifolia]
MTAGLRTHVGEAEDLPDTSHHRYILMGMNTWRGAVVVGPWWGAMNLILNAWINPREVR